MKTTLLFSLLLITFSAHAFRAKLTSAELQKIKKGQQVERVQELEGKVFPKVTLITVIPHSPKQNMDVFSDFEDHKNFVPGLVKSKIVKKTGNQVDVDFELHMPMPVSNSQYVTRHTIKTEGKDYILTWKLLKSEQIKDSEGTVMFEEYEDKTLFTYVNHVTPASTLAWVVKDKVVPDIKKNLAVVMAHLDETIRKQKE